MDGFDLDSIAPLVHSTTPNGRSMGVIFRCPASMKQVPTHWVGAPNGTSGMLGRDAHTARYRVRKGVNALIRECFGYGYVGRWTRTLADKTLAGSQPSQLSTAEEEQGVLEAFMGISTQFARSNGRWVHASVVGLEPDPLRHLIGERELSSYERDIGARMMVAVAQAADGLTADERLFLTDVAEDSIDSLLQRPALTPAELSRVSPPGKRQLLALAWAMAFADESFDKDEESVIESFGLHMGIDEVERIGLKQDAQTHVLEQFLEQTTARGDHDQISRDRLNKLAEQLDVRAASVQRIEARFLQRHSEGRLGERL